MKRKYIFEAQIMQNKGMDAAYIIFPYDIRKEFGKGRVSVEASFDGVPYKGSIVNMGVKNEAGEICFVIGIRKDIRNKIGKSFGDTVKVEISAL